MMDKMEQYIDNIAKFGSYKDKEQEFNDADVLFSYLSQTAVQNKKIYEINKVIFKEEILKKLHSLSSFTDQDYQQYFAFGQRLFNVTNNIDIGGAHEVYAGLIEYARLTKNIDYLICNLYWKAISLFYLGNTLFIDEMHACFKEVVSYKNSYFTIKNKETRKYFNRCYGNYYMVLIMKRDSEHFDFEECIVVGKEILKFWNDPTVIEFDPDFDFSAFKVNVHVNTLSLLDYLRTQMLKFETPEPMIVDRIDKSLEVVTQSFNEYGTKKIKISENRLKYSQLFIQYFKGQMSIDEVIECIYAIIKMTAEDDYGLNGVYVTFHLSGLIILYLNNTSIPESRRTMMSEYLIDRTFNYLKNISNKGILEININLINNFITGLVHYKAHEEKIDEYLKNIIDLSVKRHLTLYVHSKVVSKIATVIVSYFLEHDPFVFVGANGYRDIKAVLINKENLLKQIDMCGLSFDLGKVNFVGTLFSQTRELSSSDEVIIKNHTTINSKFYGSNFKSQIIEDCAVGHHKWFNGMGGYPEEFNNLMSPNKIFIDIISVADTIDAATDQIGRSFKETETLDQIIDYIVENAGTKYSPAIAKILKLPAIYDEINKILTEERVKIYFEGYKSI